MHVCDLCGERLSMITSGITHTKKSILQGGLLKNCRAGGGGSKTDRWRSHVTPGGQLAGQRRKGEIKNSMLALQVYLATVFTECLESNYRIG